MTKSALAGIIAILLAAVCITLLVVALVTRDTSYLLIESAILHFGIIFTVLSAFEHSRRDG